MKRINDLAWIIIAISSILVGTWVWGAEGATHSKFYVFYILAALCLTWVFRSRLFRRKSPKLKKRR